MKADDISTISGKDEVADSLPSWAAPIMIEHRLVVALGRIEGCGENSLTHGHEEVVFLHHFIALDGGLKSDRSRRNKAACQ